MMYYIHYFNKGAKLMSYIDEHGLLITEYYNWRFLNNVPFTDKNNSGFVVEVKPANESNVLKFLIKLYKADDDKGLETLIVDVIELRSPHINPKVKHHEEFLDENYNGEVLFEYLYSYIHNSWLYPICKNTGWFKVGTKFVCMDTLNRPIYEKAKLIEPTFVVGGGIKEVDNYYIHFFNHAYMVIAQTGASGIYPCATHFINGSRKHTRVKNVCVYESGYVSSFEIVADCPFSHLTGKKIFFEYDEHGRVKYISDDEGNKQYFYYPKYGLVQVYVFLADKDSFDYYYEFDLNSSKGHYIDGLPFKTPIEQIATGELTQDEIYQFI